MQQINYFRQYNAIFEFYIISDIVQNTPVTALLTEIRRRIDFKMCIKEKCHLQSERVNKLFELHETRRELFK